MNLATAKWLEHPGNPHIHPEPPNWLLGDPTLLTPDRSPDGRWHLFCNSVKYVYHYVGDDGVSWTRQPEPVCRGMRSFIFVEDGVYYLFFELHAPTLHRSSVMMRQSTDLATWSEQREMVGPRLPWDGRLVRFVGNPSVIKVGDRYRLYHSASCIVLVDTIVTEPLYIGIAEADSIDGPYRRHPVPLLGPDPDHPYRNRGAGSIKVYHRDGGGFWAFNNGIYRDRRGRHGSAIMLLESDDGYRFRQLHDEPIIKPDEGWKKAFVYAFDLTVFDGETRLYFNARDGWAKGKEFIGFATAKLD